MAIMAQPEPSTSAPSVQSVRRLVKRALRDLGEANRELARVEAQIASDYGITIDRTEDDS
jgi:hypothetical protein